MVQSVTNHLPQPVYGFESSSRFGASASKTEGGDSRSASSSVSKKSDDALVKRLTSEEERIVQELKQTDRKVRAHEQAHLSVGADLVRGGANFSYETGPDQKRYAVGGEVSIDTSPARTPEETIPKAQHIRATALAPADPSTQDRRVAAQASVMELDARGEVSAQRREQAIGATTEASSAMVEDGGQGSVGFYRGVEQTNANVTRVGGVFDSFA